MEAEKKVELVEEELAAHRLQNSRLTLTNQRLQEEVSKCVDVSKRLSGVSHITCEAPIGDFRVF